MTKTWLVASLLATTIGIVRLVASSVDTRAYIVLGLGVFCFFLHVIFKRLPR